MPTTGSTRAVPRAARCRSCGYSLRGLSEHRCPECDRTFDPARRGTMRLPLRPQSRLGRIFPAIGILAVALGTYQPGWDNRIFIAGVIIFAGCVLGTLPSWIAWAAVRTRISSAVAEPFRQWNRRLAWAAVICVALAVLRPTMYLCFWVSKPWLD